MSAEYNHYFLLQRIPEIISAGSGGLFVSLWNCCLQWIIATERGAYTNWLVQFIWSVCLVFKYLKGHIKSIYIYVCTVVNVISVVRPTIHDKHVCCCCETDSPWQPCLLLLLLWLLCVCVCVRARVSVCVCVCLILEHVPPCIIFQQIYLLQVTNTETASQIITVHGND